MSKPVPDLDYRIFDDENLFEPFAGYRMLRDEGAVVRLPEYDLFVLARYADVSAALSNWQVFSSASGVAMNEAMNTPSVKPTVANDPPAHQVMRRVVGRPLNAQALQALRDRITTEAEAIVGQLVGRKQFDGATDLAQHLPLVVVSHLVGLPEEYRRTMIDLSAAAFDASGPMNDRTRRSLARLAELGGFAFTQLPREAFAPGSWAAQLFEAADRGEILPEQVAPMLADYVIPSLDTTIAAITNAIQLFAEHPDQWDALRDDPTLVSNAINEVVRIESPIQGFSRRTTEDHAIDGVIIPQGARVLVLFGSANRDERKWRDPDRFDIRRRPLDHVGFGYGVHRCVGANLAHMEMAALFKALIPRVSRYSLDGGVREINSLVRGWRTLPVSTEPEKQNLT